VGVVGDVDAAAATGDVPRLPRAAREGRLRLGPHPDEFERGLDRLDPGNGAVAVAGHAQRPPDAAQDEALQAEDLDTAVAALADGQIVARRDRDSGRTREPPPLRAV